MEAADFLTTVAQLAIGVAGFSGIAIIFKRDPGPLTDIDAYRIAVLFANAFAAMFISLLTFPLHDLFDNVDVVWRFGSAVTAAFTACFLAYFLIRTRRFRREVPELFSTAPLLLAVSGHAVNLIVQTANAADLFATRQSAVFLLGTLWLLFHSTYQFGRILFVQPSRALVPALPELGKPTTAATASIT